MEHRRHLHYRVTTFRLFRLGSEAGILALDRALLPRFQKAPARAVRATPNFREEVALAVSMEYQARMPAIFPWLNIIEQARRYTTRFWRLNRQRVSQRATDTVFTRRQDRVSNNEFKGNV
jgi:hypothetical protein